MIKFKNNIALIGIGRVGLPLALTLCDSGFKTIGIDIDIPLIDKVNRKIFPFHEPGYSELIKKVDFRCTPDTAEIADCENIIITVGTPLLSHIETDLSQVTRVINSIIPFLREGHNIILRSTIAPKTTLFVRNLLEQKTEFKVGSEIFLSFCPERLAEGKAMVELRELPQIVGAEDPASASKAEKIFEKVTVEVIHTNYVSAELVKLFNNISRYVHFSVANQLAYIADEFDVDIYDIIHMTNHKYPRGVIPQPGMTAGTCLRKDFGMINETIPYTDLLLSAWKVNEFTPKFLVDNMKRRALIFNKKIAVLGYTFKNDVDDTRDSLIPKLIRYIERENPACVRVHEPNIEGKLDMLYENYTLKDALENVDIVFFAINHKAFKNGIGNIFNLCNKDTWFSDIWNLGGAGKLFYQNPKYHF
jgi:UDP-N-acetyl-D-mannosaminuronic acid dehydrogenase